MRVRPGGVVAGILFGLFGGSPSLEAQSLGVFRWQTQPFCNVITVAVTQVGGVYRLEGTDDQCGAATQASVIGTAFLNANGTIGLGFTIVGTPGGAPLTVDATVSLPAVQGTWRDSAGRTGTFMPTPGAGTGGSPRPAAGLGAAAVDTTQIQRRIANGCPAGQAVRTVNQDGTVVCQSTSGGGGTITGVTAGTGLTGGGTSGAVTLNVNLDGPGSASTVARSDHTHNVGIDNTRVGFNALGSTSRRGVTAVGFEALRGTNVGDYSVAVGFRSLWSATTNSQSNVAIGAEALVNLSSGASNIAVGDLAGSQITTGNLNIMIGNTGFSSDGATIRIGAGQTRAFVSGIRGITTGSATGIPVLIDSNGQLGTVSSSRRVKQDIAPMGDGTRGLFDLRPVTFRYISHAEAGSTTLEYGLIAEEVAEIYPDLVVRNAGGEIETVQYHKLAPMLLNEVQRLERERAALAEEVARLAALVERLLAATTDGRPR